MSQSVMSKAAMTTTTLAGGGLLLRQQANKFINLVAAYQNFLNVIRTIPINHAKGEIDKIDLTTPVTRKATENNTESTTSQAAFSKIQYDTTKTVTTFDVSMEAEEDSIEGKAFRNTLMRVFTDRVGTDMAMLSIEGDASLGGSDVTSLLLKTYNGAHVLTTSCPNILDANGLGVSLKMFKDGLNKLPVRYKGRIRGLLRWFIASNPKEDFDYVFGNRATTGGDTVFKEAPRLAPFGIPMEECPLIPVDLTIGTAATDGTFLWLANPSNFMWFVQRKITIHFEFKPRKDTTEVTIYMRTAFQIEDLNSIVKVRGVSADAATNYS